MINAHRCLLVWVFASATAPQAPDASLLTGLLRNWERLQSPLRDLSVMTLPALTPTVINFSKQLFSTPGRPNCKFPRPEFMNTRPGGSSERSAAANTSLPTRSAGGGCRSPHPSTASRFEFPEETRCHSDRLLGAPASSMRPPEKAGPSPCA